MKFVKNIIAILLLLSVAVACSKDSPEVVAARFRNAIDKMDFEAARACVSKEALPTFDVLVKMANVDIPDLLAEDEQTATYSIKNTAINDREDKATVAIQMIDSCGTILDELEYSLIKEEDGEWRIVF